MREEAERADTALSARDDAVSLASLEKEGKEAAQQELRISREEAERQKTVMKQARIVRKNKRVFTHAVGLIVK